jgi:hypothetical protein
MHRAAHNVSHTSYRDQQKGKGRVLHYVNNND